MRVHLVDPSAYTPPYDHALCAALVRAGAQVELVTTRFDYAEVPSQDGYEVREAFYRWSPGAPGSGLRRAAKLVQHVPDVLGAVEGPVVLFFGLLRPYKGLDVLLDAWKGIGGAELWVVGMPRMPLGSLRSRAAPGVRFVPRYVADAELPAYFRRADLVV